MIFWFTMVGLALVYTGGAFFDIDFKLSLFLAGMGAAMLGLMFASQERLLRGATNAAAQREEGHDSE